MDKKTSRREKRKVPIRLFLMELSGVFYALNSFWSFEIIPTKHLFHEKITLWGIDPHG
jgi:hypothetical protein